MPDFRRLLSVLVATVVVLQPAYACCAEQTAAADTAPAQQAPAAERPHCGEVPAPVAEPHRCDCGDRCASLTALSPQAPAVALLHLVDDVSPAAIVARMPAMPPAARVVVRQGLPPPRAAPLSRPTLVSLKRLLLI